MANVIKEQKIIDTNKRALIKYVATLDTAAANTILMNPSTLRFSLNANGYIMQSGTHPKTTYRTTIKRIFGNARANGYIKLTWHGANYFSSSDYNYFVCNRFDFTQFMGDKNYRSSFRF